MENSSFSNDESRRAGRRAVCLAGVNISFPEHNSTTVGNILLILGEIVKQVNAVVAYKSDNSAYHHFLIMSPDPYFSSFSFSEHSCNPSVKF